MNDPNKAINVNLSSLLSLKAELLRKQAEVNKAKATRTANDEYTSSITSRIKKKSDHIEVTKKSDGSIVYECEDSALLEESKRILEAKSKFYERMSRSGGTLNSDDNCLVRFNRKQQDEKSIPRANTSNETISESKDSDSNSSDSDDNEISLNSDDDWVEYTDCLGRTRTCLRKDLDDVKKRDAKLAASIPERLDQTKANWMIDIKGDKRKDDENECDNDSDSFIGPPAPRTESIFSDGCSLMSKHDEQRINWEKKEQENLEKTEVHYQDVFFDEARQHGVGYYAFSTDEDERKRQQQELEEARQRTKSEQERRDVLRIQREKIIAERVRAAKNRQRAQLGLPPIDLEDIEKEQQPKDVDPKETKEERKARKKAQKLKLRQEAKEAEREQERQAHIRPWDQDKEDLSKKGNKNKSNTSSDGFVAGETEWSYKFERLPLSQEEWNERKRNERIAKFAPVPEPEAKLKRSNFSNAAESSRNYNVMGPPTTFASFQTTKKEKIFLRKNYNAADEESNLDDRDGVAIPPPVNLDADYGLPPHAKRIKTSQELENSIAAGLRFIRENCDKGTMSTKSSWTSKADY